MILSSQPARPARASATLRGTHVCVNCGFALAAEAGDELPECPSCGASEFRPTGLFKRPTIAPRRDLQVEHEWIEEARESLAPGSDPCLTFRDDEIVHMHALDESITRIGRSPIAHVLLDDPTVSRRHAMVAREDDTLTIFDDRSLNGVFVNGERVEQAVLQDGDEIVIGSVHLYLVVP